MNEDICVKSVRQIVSSSGLWLRRVAVTDDVAAQPPFDRVAEFTPVVAIALVELEEQPSTAHFLGCAVVPLTGDDLMYGFFERTPYLGLQVRQQLYHDCDFEELGARLKPQARPRSVHCADPITNEC